MCGSRRCLAEKPCSQKLQWKCTRFFSLQKGRAHSAVVLVGDGVGVEVQVEVEVVALDLTTGSDC